MSTIGLFSNIGGTLGLFLGSWIYIFFFSENETSNMFKSKSQILIIS